MALVISGDSPSFSGTYQGGVITSGTAVASTSGTSITFSSIPSWVKRITVMFNGVSVSSTALPIVQLGTSSGVVTSGYSGLGMYITSGPGLTTNSSGFIVNNVGTAAQAISGSLILNLLNSSSNLWEANGTFVGTGTYNQIAISGGAITLSSLLTQLVITTIGGTNTFTAGSINILYE